MPSFKIQNSKNVIVRPHHIWIFKSYHISLEKLHVANPDRIQSKTTKSAVVASTKMSSKTRKVARFYIDDVDLAELQVKRYLILTVLKSDSLLFVGCQKILSQ